MASAESTNTNPLLGSLLFATSAIAALSLHSFCEPKDRSQNASNESWTGDRIQYWTDHEKDTNFLEEIRGEAAMKWVKGRNSDALKVLGSPNDNPLFSRILGILNNNDKIPYVTKIGSFYYNIWKDKDNKRGLIRRTTVDSYRSSDPVWEKVLDIDELSKKEDKNWVFSTWTLFEPDTIGVGCDSDDNSSYSRILLHLSNGGSDAIVVREFDLQELRFIEPDSPEMGFYLPLGKSNVAWRHKDLLVVCVDSLEEEKDKDDNNGRLGLINPSGSSASEPPKQIETTRSGYPLRVREWARGTKLAESKVVFSGMEEDVIVYATVSRHHGYTVEFRTRYLTFFTQKTFIRLLCTNPSSNNTSSPATSATFTDWVELTIPEDATLSHCFDQMLISLRSDWLVGSRSFISGSLLAVPLSVLLLKTDDGSLESSITELYTPSERSSLEAFAHTKSCLVLTIFENVKTRLQLWGYSSSGWTLVGQESASAVRGVTVTAVDPHANDQIWLTVSSFLHPPALLLVDFGAARTSLNVMSALEEAVEELAQVRAAGVTNFADCRYVVKRLANQFVADNFVELQCEAISRDGTVVPYFIVRPRNLPLNGQNPTLLYGYGGFEVSLSPAYQAVCGCGWLERGGVYVSACIRGGGEFGPSWHQAAQRQKKMKSYEDFIAVAEHLVLTGVTSPRYLGIRGGSNGGLLVTNVMLMRPDLFRAVTAAVPLTDMRRFHRLLAGNSWVDEFGDPDRVEDWEYMKHFSSAHNIDVPQQSTAGVPYPHILLTTSTNDDRVHPYHARVFAHRLLTHKQQQSTAATKAPGDRHVLYYENTEGGHGGAADNAGVAFMNTLYLTFLWKVMNED